MLVAIHQPHYLPWLRYFEKLHRADAFILLDTVQYSKNGWQNRNKVKTASGVALVTVPVLNQTGTRIIDMPINTAVPWQRKHWRTIQQAYGRAPYFDTFAPALEAMYAREWTSLNELNRYGVETFAKALGVTTPIYHASELNVEGVATERLVNLIKAVGGDAYYSGAYALEAYLDADLLDAAGIRLVLQEWEAPVYPQLHGTFERDLSIVDLLMNCGPNALEVLTQCPA